MAQDRTITALGLMSGTAMDGIDAAILTTDGTRIRAAGPWASFTYPPPLRARLGAAVAAGDGADPGTLAALEAELTDVNAAAVLALLRDSGLEPAAIDVIGYHGQTVLHRPERRLTRQLGDGARLARTTGIDVVNDFRAADVAAGGQGAPFAPLYHLALADGLERPLAVLNLGGVANVTYIGAGPAEDLLAFDTGPGNAMIDDWVAERTGRPCDEDGRLAAAGRADSRRLARLLDHGYFDLAPPKSLDRNDFPPDPVAGLSLEDGCATLTAFTARSVARALDHLPALPRRWLVTGGGRHNPTLMAALSRALRRAVEIQGIARL